MRILVAAFACLSLVLAGCASMEQAQIQGSLPESTTTAQVTKTAPSHSSTPSTTAAAPSKSPTKTQSTSPLASHETVAPAYIEREVPVSFDGHVQGVACVPQGPTGGCSRVSPPTEGSNQQYILALDDLAVWRMNLTVTWSTVDPTVQELWLTGRVIEDCRPDCGGYGGGQTDAKGASPLSLRSDWITPLSDYDAPVHPILLLQVVPPLSDYPISFFANGGADFHIEGMAFARQNT